MLDICKYLDEADATNCEPVVVTVWWKTTAAREKKPGGHLLELTIPASLKIHAILTPAKKVMTPNINPGSVFFWLAEFGDPLC